MKLKDLALVVLAMAMISVSAQAARRTGDVTLPSDVLAQVTIAGGFMAPGMANTTIYGVKTNGDIVKTHYTVRDFGPAVTVTEVIGHMPEAKIRAMIDEIAHVQAGQLVDVDPNGPQGADFPSVAYYVNAGETAIEIAVRHSDMHLFILEQASARALKQMLDEAIAAGNNR